MDLTLWLLLAATALNLALLLTLLARASRTDPLAAVPSRLDALERSHERMERAVREEIAKGRDEAAGQTRAGREELAETLARLSTGMLAQLTAMGTTHHDQFTSFAGQIARLTAAGEERMQNLQQAVEARLVTLQTENAQKLDEMRKIVDEKLQSTLEKRLGESFRQVSDRLEQVHRGLGEMQVLASGVGDLKKVLTNVKTRGTWGEVQLGNVLEQILSPAQYARNVAPIPGSGDRVEFVIRLPGRRDDDQEVLLPIDAKFPVEDYLRIAEAHDAGDLQAIEVAGGQLETRIRNSARDIAQKYISPPHTTDFGIMYLPTEGLYAEVIRRTGLVESLQRDHKVVVTGPTTLTALLNSLQMGFRTLAIEKRSSEVWTVLGAVKTEFEKFGGVLEKVKKKLQEASNVVDGASVRSRAVQRSLRNVQALPAQDPAIAALPPGVIDPLAVVEAIEKVVWEEDGPGADGAERR